MEASTWRNGVRVVRGETLAQAMHGPFGTGRATAFDFTGAGGKETWIGRVTLPPLAETGLHHHGRHEAAVYVVKGRSEIRWGERLEFAADVGPGDFVYFAPYGAASRAQSRRRAYARFRRGTERQREDRHRARRCAG